MKTVDEGTGDDQARANHRAGSDLVSPAYLIGRGHGPPISRNPVTPFARNRGKDAAGCSAFHQLWTCMSQRPGMRYLRERQRNVPVFGT
jgi:hypothetical protein